MNVFAVQLDIVWEDKAANHQKVRQLLDQTPPAPGSLVVLPEMFATGFSMRAAVISDTASQETQQFLAETAKAFGVYLAGGVVTTGKSGQGRNECVVYDPVGQEIARYCKRHPFTYGGESDHYEPGEEVCLFAWEGFKVAPFICYDLRFPESFRAAVKQGANLILVMANWPVTRIMHWEVLLQARAIENQAYVLGVNRTGQDPTLSYSGSSRIISPRGDLLVTATASEGVIQTEVSLADLERYRRDLPFLADMRG
ncbi:MAG: carbon-nitrogen family hydrolase [Acidobacteria bacterium]|nr:carbon-nitrogen family hydrolase [Acidobacteriota bacterium]MBI3421486.1 carbon-nitrogen family hydrolase [Acidobacteriota bacterium]